VSKNSQGFSRVHIDFSRLLILALIIILSILGYIIYFFNLQIVKGTEFKEKARNVSLRSKLINGQRGEIFDRHFDIPLATNKDSFAIYIIPGNLDNLQIESSLKNLSGIINISYDKISLKLPSSYRHLFTEIELVNGISYENIIKIAENKMQLPGITWDSKPIRNYVATGSIAHVLGYVGEITKDELQILYNRGYHSKSVIGKSGIEKEYDSILKGTDGVFYRTVDVRGREITDDQSISPQKGKDLVLTIDRKMQLLAEKALGDRKGSVVILKPHNGEILAMVSSPWFNPNIIYEDNGPSRFQSLTIDKDFPFLNRAIQSTKPPASLFKVIMSTAILNENTFPKDRTIICNGEVFYGDRTFHCWFHSGHGPVDLEQALINSCNIFFFTIGRDFLGINNIKEYSEIFGLGVNTGIDLPGEVPGLVPSPDWKYDRFKQPWTAGDTMNTSIGQGYLLVTPLQMANAFAMIVNEGVTYVPHILKRIISPENGEVIEEREPIILTKSQINSTFFKDVKKYMREVVTSGTAEVAMLSKATTVAAKTGTGEIGIEDQFHSWFGAFAPYETNNPEEQIVIMTMVEASEEYEWWAPIATDIIVQGIFAEQTYEEAVKTLKPWYLDWRSME